MKKAALIIIGVLAVVAVIIYVVIHAVLGFFGYLNPLERYLLTRKTETLLAKKYPEHDFTFDTDYDWAEYGFYFNIYATDENGVRFRVQWIEGEMDDHYYCVEWNDFFYGNKIVEYQNSLRDKYFPQIPYVDTYEYAKDDSFDFPGELHKKVFFQSVDEAIEASKAGIFDTDVTFKGIDLSTADDDEIRHFAESMADSLMWLHEVTGYYHIMINSFSYIEYDGSGAGVKTKEELVDKIIKRIERERERESQYCSLEKKSWISDTDEGLTKDDR